MKQLDYDGFVERQYKLLQEKDKFVSLDEFESMKSTLEVLSDTELLQQIDESEEDYKAGRYKKLRDLIKESEKDWVISSLCLKPTRTTVLSFSCILKSTRHRLSK